MMGSFNLKDAVLVLEDMDGSMKVCSAGKSASGRSDLLTLCINFYRSSSLLSVMMPR